VTQASTAAAGSWKSLDQLYDYKRGPRQWAVCNATTCRDGPDCLRVWCRSHDGRGEKVIKMIDRQLLG
jgi:hypothetical protein